MYNKNFLLKKLSKGGLSSGGRNSGGRTTVFHLGGGHKKKHRLVNHFYHQSVSARFFIQSIEYNPLSSAHIMGTLFSFSENSNLYGSYFKSTLDIGLGDSVSFGPSVYPRVGNSTFLGNIPTGTAVHSLESFPKSGPVFARSAGVSAYVARNDGTSDILVKLPSGKYVELNSKCYAVVGTVSNKHYGDRVLRKAGVSRWLGHRPIVRGIAMNPVDHPHGGRTDGGKHPSTPWGKLTRGVKTKSVHKRS